MSRDINHSWKNGGDNSSNPVVVVLDNGHVLITADADTDADGSPDAVQIDGSGQLQTALGRDNGWKGDGDYVNARIIPYYVLPGNWKEVTNVSCQLGDIAKVSYKNKTVYAIYADVGPDEITGEASIATVEALGHNPWNNEHTKIVSGIPHGVTFDILAAVKRTAIPKPHDLGFCFFPEGFFAPALTDLLCSGLMVALQTDTASPAAKIFLLALISRSW